MLLYCFISELDSPGNSKSWKTLKWRTSGRFPTVASCSRTKSCTIALRIRFKCKVEPPSSSPPEWNLLFYDTSLRTFPVHILLRKPFFQVATGPASVRSLLSALLNHGSTARSLSAIDLRGFTVCFLFVGVFFCEMQLHPACRRRKDSSEINPRSILRYPSVVHRMFFGKLINIFKLPLDWGQWILKSPSRIEKKKP